MNTVYHNLTLIGRGLSMFFTEVSSLGVFFGIWNKKLEYWNVILKVY